MSNPKNVAKPRRRRLNNDPIKPGQYLLLKPQVLELCGNPSYSTVWLWMKEAGFPHPIELGPRNGRTSRVAWLAAEVFTWLQARPRRAIGDLKQSRKAQETRKLIEATPPRRRPGRGSAG